MLTCPPWIVYGKWRRSRRPDRTGVFHILCGLSVDSPVEIPLRPHPEGPFVRLPLFWASRIRTRRSAAPGLTLRMCPPFFLLWGYPRERISYGSGVPPVLPTVGVPQGAHFVREWGAPLLRRLRRPLLSALCNSLTFHPCWCLIRNYRIHRTDRKEAQVGKDQVRDQASQAEPESQDPQSPRPLHREDRRQGRPVRNRRWNRGEERRTSAQSHVRPRARRIEGRLPQEDRVTQGLSPGEGRPQGVEEVI